MSKKNLLADIRVVRQWACKEYDLQQGDIELLFKLHDLERFTWGDFIDGTVLLGWDKKRWYRLKDNNWVKVYRAKADKHSRYNIYCLTRRATTMINKVYSILNGDEPIPSKLVKHAQSRKSSYSDKVLATAIRGHNNKFKNK